MTDKKKIGERLAIGAAQFGLDYGVSNTHGKVGESEVRRILLRAYDKKIDTIDTAVIYGDSEKTLGRVGVSNFNIVTKLPPAPDHITNTDVWARENIENSINRLKVDNLYGLMLHKSSDFLGSKGANLYSFLCKLKSDGIINKIGVSIYSPDELLNLEKNNIKVDIVQAPFNILDRRLLTSGWLKKMKKSGIEVHIRSVFLQGLLLIDFNKRNKYFSKWKSHFEKFEKWINESNQTPLEACLNFVFSYNEIDKIIVGVENINHLSEILLAIDDSCWRSAPDYLQINDTMLIDPSNWILQ